ncbi:MAG TPA: Ig-like domain-containing protein [Ornithinibacter sp.]|nr:Ig-like domain-containing protein [Ornithinibacter sp.]
MAAPSAAVATASPASAATEGVTSFSYVSQPGDYVGQGRSGTLSDPSQFRISGTAGLVTVGIDTGSEWWSVDLAAPRGQQLTTGVYENATRATFNTTYGGLDVSSTGRGCNEVKGRFTVHAISADTTGRITSLDATLTQFCDAGLGGLTATVRYAAPAAAPLVLTSSNPVTVADQPVTLTARVSPGTSGGVSFVDGSTVIGQATADAAGLARLTTTRLAAGTHTLTAKQSTTTSDPVTQVVAAAEPSLWFASQYGDYIGQGATTSHTPPASTVRLTGTAGSATVWVDGPTSDGWWSLDVAAPPGETLQVGTYSGAVRAAFRGAGQPGLDLSGSGRGCNTVAGSFTVHQVAANPDGSLAALDVAFTQFCEAGTTSLTGRARVGMAPTRTATTTTVAGTATSDGAVGLTASVSAPAGAPTGSVTFREGSTTLGTSAVGADGTARLEVPGLTRGSHTLTADYAGSGEHLPSTGSTTVVLPGIGTTTTMTAPRTGKHGKPLSVTATVVSAPGAALPTGQVGLYDGVEPVGVATLVGGTATITWTPVAKGTHTLTARYLGDATHAESVSAAVSLKVT